MAQVADAPLSPASSSGEPPPDPPPVQPQPAVVLYCCNCGDADGWAGGWDTLRKCFQCKHFSCDTCGPHGLCVHCPDSGNETMEIFHLPGVKAD